MDSVQCGHFRSGRFQSFQRILEAVPGGQDFLPDAISMAKSLGGGYPIGAFWVRAPYADLLGPGTHGTTYGGSPLACAVALRILEVIQRENLADNVRKVGDYLRQGLEALARKYPAVVRSIRGLGFMLGIELAPNIQNLPGDASKMQSSRFVNMLHANSLLAIPAGPEHCPPVAPLNLRRSEAEEGLSILEIVASRLAG
jgi:acetylornithine/succinyldiaminopimelate/putrescine aminotransferase